MATFILAVPLSELWISRGSGTQCPIRSRSALGTRNKTPSQRVLSTYMVECKISIFGITIMIWGSMPHNSTEDPLGFAAIKPTRTLNAESLGWLHENGYV